jgi:malate/lactate dehydrogenase
MVCARIAVLRDERAVVPIGVHSTKLGVTLSLPSIVGREDCLQVLAPLSNDERIGFEKCVETLRKAQERIADGRTDYRSSRRRRENKSLFN